MINTNLHDKSRAGMAQTGRLGVGRGLQAGGQPRHQVDAPGRQQQ